MAAPRKQTVLVVDDEPDIIEFVRVIMEDAGIEVQSASSGAECLEKVKQAVPDLIMLDVQMPGEPGFFALKKLKENPATRSIPILMLTGVGERLGLRYSPQDMYDFLGQEPDAFLEKPVDPALLLSTAKKLLGRPSSQSPAE
ncbi:response regulator [bacterium]|nr:response regulator [bacterium]